MTHEEAVGYLQESGWLQDHDKQIYEQGKRDGIKERKTGRWILKSNGGGWGPKVFMCSACQDAFYPGADDMKYCPNCGAKMEEKRDGIEERKTGRWNEDGTCSVCGTYSSLNLNKVKYCPECGEKMKGAEEDND